MAAKRNYGEYNMSIDCQLKERKPQPSLAIRTRAPVQALPQTIGNAYAAIGEYLQQLGEHTAGAPYAAYFNMDMQDLDIELGFPTAKPLSEKDKIIVSEIPGGQFATCLHTGPYSDVEPTYNALFQWMQAQGYTWTGVAYEFYMNDPDETPPEQLQTQIFLPIKSA
jgi:effector-binding domain-containing protein